MPGNIRPFCSRCVGCYHSPIRVISSHRLRLWRYPWLDIYHLDWATETTSVSESDSDTVRRWGVRHVMYIKITAGAVKLRLDRDSGQRPSPPCHPALFSFHTPSVTFYSHCSHSNLPTRHPIHFHLTPPPPLTISASTLLASHFHLCLLLFSSKPCSLLSAAVTRDPSFLAVLFHFTFFLPNRHFPLPTNPQPISPNLFSSGCHHLCLSSFCLNLFGPISLFV